MILKRSVLRFLRIEDRLSHNLIVVASSLQILGAGTEIACLPRFIESKMGNT